VVIVKSKKHSYEEKTPIQKRKGKQSIHKGKGRNTKRGPMFKAKKMIARKQKEMKKKHSPKSKTQA
jgi:hypothetical protein